MTGTEIHQLASRLFPICRSITGDGVRKTLRILQELLPSLAIHEVPSGAQAFDWTIPREWKVRDAYIVTPAGDKICRLQDNNLHLVGYSVPVRKKLTLAELEPHLYSLPDLPTAIPYVTSYFVERWGFCLSHDQRKTLTEGTYEVVVDTELFDGSLTYGELLIPGASKDEIFVSTYVCHPSMANNEVSGPAVATYLAKWVASLPERKYSYRFVFIPETIGSLAYLSRNIEHLKARVKAGFNVSCVGDYRAYSYLPSRHGDTISDRIAKHVLKWHAPSFVSYPWTARGSDERQYCAPGVDLPIATMMRTKYNAYPEYHTSLDDLVNVVTPKGLEGGFTALQRALEALERNAYPLVTVLGEPQMGKRGLYPTISTGKSGLEVRLMMNLFTWSDGKASLLEVADKCGVPMWDLYAMVDKLRDLGLLKLSQTPLA